MERNKHAILMCKPEHFEIKYEISPWMDTKRKANTPSLTYRSDR